MKIYPAPSSVILLSPALGQLHDRLEALGQLHDHLEALGQLHDRLEADWKKNNLSKNGFLFSIYLLKQKLLQKKILVFFLMF